MPPVFRLNDVYQKAWRVIYSDIDPSLVESETLVTYDAGLPRDAMSGAGAVEIVLTKVLG